MAPSGLKPAGGGVLIRNETITVWIWRTESVSGFSLTVTVDAGFCMDCLLETNGSGVRGGEVREGQGLSYNACLTGGVLQGVSKQNLPFANGEQISPVEVKQRGFQRGIDLESLIANSPQHQRHKLWLGGTGVAKAGK